MSARCPCKPWLDSTSSYFSITKHMGNPRNSKNAGPCASSAVEADVIGQPSNRTEARFVDKRIDLEHAMQTNYAFLHDAGKSATEVQGAYMWESAAEFLRFVQGERNHFVNYLLSAFPSPGLDFSTFLKF